MMNRFFLVAKALGLATFPITQAHWFEHTDAEEQAFNRALLRTKPHGVTVH
ncbi:MAG: hypothetical protein K9H25_07700 [Rhodospirillum sp.]|nr:hypothetical protein [Rhodospirillum sp.]MCF8491207.1 hypothetical protein [Rhodospirillum sp.]MCF8503095.1 hypothetical protein [Rhodospirillum sp.]